MSRGSALGRWAAISAAALALALVGAAWLLERRDEQEAARPEAPDATQDTRREVATGEDAPRKSVEPTQPPVWPTQVNPAFESNTPEVALWRMLEGEPPPWPGAVEGFVTHKKRVRIERDALSSLDVGARIAFELPDGARHVARVESLTVHDNGDRTWSGHLVGSGVDHPVVYTQGELWTFATLVTPQGLYALEAEGEEGVLFKDGREAMQRDHDKCSLIPE